MTTRDLVNDVDVNNLLVATISSDTDTFSAAVDTADFDMGVGFYARFTNYTDGDYALSVQDSDDGSTDWQDVTADSLQITEEVSASGDQTVKQGAFGTRRFQRAKITSTNVTTGADVAILAVKAAELKPTNNTPNV